jgi:hypothetical protein
MDEWMNGWMDGWMVEWMYEWIEQYEVFTGAMIERDRQGDLL